MVVQALIGIRYFFPLDRPRPFHFQHWPEVGFAYLEMLSTLDVPVRAIGWATGGYGHIGEGRYAPYAKLFQTALPERYINLVCGPEHERLWTKGVSNLAISNGRDSYAEVYWYYDEMLPQFTHLAKPRIERLVNQC